ncbi:MAG: hypothetical protein U1C46_00200 [Bacteroidales bacterium]|nr:hypothetical protein [Bacteroidales bacterium]MDZ4203211.1 hypothetical protein [Bacteroidales bacterium]
MKSKLLNIFLPAIAGAAVVFALLIGIAFIRDGHYTFSYHEGDRLFYLIFVPAAFAIAWIVQWVFVIPTWNKLIQNRKVLGLKTYQVIALISLIGGVLLGFLFWDTSFGINDLLAGIAWSIGIFAIYGAVNVLTLRWLRERCHRNLK